MNNINIKYINLNYILFLLNLLIFIFLHYYWNIFSNTNYIFFKNDYILFQFIFFCFFMYQCLTYLMLYIFPSTLKKNESFIQLFIGFISIYMTINYINLDSLNTHEYEFIFFSYDYRLFPKSFFYNIISVNYDYNYEEFNIFFRRNIEKYLESEHKILLDKNEFFPIDIIKVKWQLYYEMYENIFCILFYYSIFLFTLFIIVYYKFFVKEIFIDYFPNNYNDFIFFINIISYIIMIFIFNIVFLYYNEFINLKIEYENILYINNIILTYFIYSN